MNIFLSGIFVGIFFDIYRMVRWRIGLNRISTLIGDLFFSVISLLVIFYFAQKANYLELRFYLFAGSLFGLLFYLRFLSKYIKWLINQLLNLLVFLCNTIYNIIASFIRAIINLLAKLMNIPYSILRWLGLLLFRIGEALGKEAFGKIKVKTGKFPKE